MSGSGPFSVGGGAYSGCPDPGDDDDYERPVPFSGLNLSGTSPDGFAYNGSRTESSPPDYSSQETWFTGTL